MSKKSIIITGSPGVGKTTVAKALSKKLGIPYFDFARFVIQKGLVESYDYSRMSFEVDVNKVKEIMKYEVQETPHIIDTLIPDVLPLSLVKIVVVLRLDPIKLALRLMQRGWRLSKIQENAEAELIGVVLCEAVNSYGYEIVREIDATNLRIEEIVDIIIRMIRGDKFEEHRPGNIDWLVKYQDPLDLSRRILRLYREGQCRS